MKKVFGCLLLSFALLLTACGTESPVPSESSSESSAESTPAPDNSQKLVWLVSQEYLDRINEGRISALNTLLKEKGCTREVVLESIKAEETTSKILLETLEKRRSSGVSTDLITPYPFMNTVLNTMEQNEYYTLAKSGILEPIGEKLKTENGKKVYDLYDDTYWAGLTVNGDIYATRHRYNAGISAASFTVNKTLLDTYNIPISDLEGKDLPELGDVLRKVYQGEKEKGENLSQISVLQVYPDSSYSSRPFSYLTKCVGVRNGQSKPEAVNIFAEEDVREYLRCLSEYASEGIINVNYQTPAEGTINEYLIQISNLYEPVEISSEIGQNDASPIETVKLPLEPLQESNLAYGFTGIASWSQKKNEAFDLLALMNTDSEVANLLAFGQEGKDYVVQDGRPMFEDETGSRFPISGRELLFVPGSLVALPASFEAVDKQEAYYKWRDEIQSSPVLGFWMDYTPVEEEIAATDEIFETYIKFWTGEVPSEDFDTEYDKLLSELEKAGIDTLVEETNQQLAAWKS